MLSASSLGAILVGKYFYYADLGGQTPPIQAVQSLKSGPGGGIGLLRMLDRGWKVREWDLSEGVGYAGRRRGPPCRTWCSRELTIWAQIPELPSSQSDEFATSNTRASQATLPPTLRCVRVRWDIVHVMIWAIRYQNGPHEGAWEFISVNPIM